MSDLRVLFVDLATQHAQERDVLQEELARVMEEGQWVGGRQVGEFETAIASYCGAAHAISVGSGTDALVLSMRALDIGPGDEVITPPNSFVASTAAIVQVGATPVFVDVQEDQNLDPSKVEAAITSRTRAIMPVHLTGRMSAMGDLLELARRHDLRVIEDAAQAVGSRLGARHAGTLGDMGCFSAHPLKNLNGMGDGGYVLTDDGALAERLGRLRNNGLLDRNTVVEWGTVSRLDSLQATVLRHRLQRLDAVIEARRQNAAAYRDLLDLERVFHPGCESDQFNSFHTFVVQVERRDALQAFLTERGVGTSIHYPIPIHLQPAARSLGYVRGDFPVTERQSERILSLPIHQFLQRRDIEYVVSCIHQFLQQDSSRPGAVRGEAQAP